LVFGTLGIELMISARNLSTRGESTISFALSELAQRNYLKAVREKAWQHSSVYSPLARYVVHAAMRISGPIRRVVPRSRSVPSAWGRGRLAAALSRSCDIWTEDTDFFGTGGAVWTPDRVEIFLKEHSKSADADEI
jgi:hypothetical protein